MNEIKIGGVEDISIRCRRIPFEHGTKTERYLVRTFSHIHRVQNNMVLLVTRFHKEFGLNEALVKECIRNVSEHDWSKFTQQEWGPYTELTEYYHQRKVLGNKTFKYEEGIDELVDLAIQHHYNSENHHPEGLDRLLDKRWELPQAMECACDLQAMAQEFGEGFLFKEKFRVSGRVFYQNHWKSKHKKRFDNWDQVAVWMELAFTCFEEDYDVGERTTAHH